MTLTPLPKVRLVTNFLIAKGPNLKYQFLKDRLLGFRIRILCLFYTAKRLKSLKKHFGGNKASEEANVSKRSKHSVDRSMNAKMNIKTEINVVPS